MYTYTYSWPECFETGIIPNNRADAALCADALTAWGNCLMGQLPNQHFGNVMVQIGQRLNILATQENLFKWSQHWLDAN